jgi:hypothetical protein
MNESDCKLITEKLLGEKWTPGLVGHPYTHEGITSSHRTFTTPQDFMDCFEKLVELGKWLPFENSAYVIYEKTENIKINDLKA